jgi:hypothetical protein
MKIKLNELITLIRDETQNLRDNAAYSGSWGDNGASILNDHLNMFLRGMGTVNSHIDYDMIIDCPPIFEKYVSKKNEEYELYLQLKKKYE